jgi:hypothetical protein
MASLLVLEGLGLMDWVEAEHSQPVSSPILLTSLSHVNERDAQFALRRIQNGVLG